MSRLRRILFLLAPLFLGLVVFGYCHSYRQTRQQPIVFVAPKAAEVTVEKDRVWHRRDDGEALHLDLYRPPGSRHPAETPLPAVLVVHSDGPESVIEEFKEWGQTTSWAKNIAAYGLVAVTFDHSSTEMLEKPRPFADEVEILLDHLRQNAESLGIDGDRLGMLTLSSAAPFALRSVLRDKPTYVRSLVIFYGALGLEAFPGDRAETVPADVVEEFDLVRYLEEDPGRVPPILLARGGRDLESLNREMDRFAERAEELGIEVEMLTHPEGEQAFDLAINDLESRRILRRALEFLVQTLSEETSSEETSSEETEVEPVHHEEPVDRPEDLAEEAPGRQ